MAFPGLFCHQEKFPLGKLRNFCVQNFVREKLKRFETYWVFVKGMMLFLSGSCLLKRFGTYFYGLESVLSRFEK